VLLVYAQPIKIIVTLPPDRIGFEIMKSSLFISSSREEIARDAPWARIIEPLPELKDGWLACDTQEAYDYAAARL
jgi:hypothetical protein